MSARDIEKEVAADFARDIAQHVMTVELDNGVHRCLHFGRPGTGVYSFRVVTWPGHLYVGGDCDDFVFTRLRDMFEFFRSDHGRVNLSYWASKLSAEGMSRGAYVFSPDLYRAEIVSRYREWLRSHGDDYTSEQRHELRQRIRHEVLSRAYDGEGVAYDAAYQFEWDGDAFFDEFWDSNLKDYTHGFVWACHAIVWAIQQYDAAKASAQEVAHA